MNYNLRSKERGKKNSKQSKPKQIETIETRKKKKYGPNTIGEKESGIIGDIAGQSRNRDCGSRASHRC